MAAYYDLRRVDHIADVYGTRRAWELATDFMTAYLMNYNSKISELGKRCLDVAMRVRRSEIDLAELTAACDEYWTFMNTLPRVQGKVRLDSIEGAVYCVLFPPPEDDPHEVSDLLLEFLRRANGVEDHSEKIESLVEKCFGNPECLNRCDAT